MPSWPNIVHIQIATEPSGRFSYISGLPYPAVPDCCSPDPADPMLKPGHNELRKSASCLLPDQGHLTPEVLQAQYPSR